MSSELLETKPLTVGEKVFLEKIVERCPTMRDEDEECHKRFVRGYWEEVKKHGPEGGFDPPVDVNDSGQDMKNLEEAIEEYSGRCKHTASTAHSCTCMHMPYDRTPCIHAPYTHKPYVIRSHTIRHSSHTHTIHATFHCKRISLATQVL
jgi:hypothetical protein